MKKLLALTLTLCFLLGLFPAVSLAQSDETGVAVSEPEVAENVSVTEEAEAVPEETLSAIWTEAVPEETFSATETEAATQTEETVPVEELQPGKTGSGQMRISAARPLPDESGYAQWKTALYGSLDETADLFSVSGNAFENQYLNVYVNDNGQFTMGTVEGNPNTDTDNSQMLLFGHPGSHTSETVIRIDGVDYRFHGSDAVTTRYDGYSETVRTIAGVEVRQTLTFVNNQQTGREDIVRIRYDYKNTTSQAKEVGVRIMLDTMLGYNDGAPFRVGVDQVTTEKEYTGDEIPQYWICLDSFIDTQVVSVGTLYTNLENRPDKVQFAYWPYIMDSSWDYAVSSEYMYDTAVAVYFNPAEVAAGASGMAETYYGISETDPVPDDGKLSMQIVKETPHKKSSQITKTVL